MKDSIIIDGQILQTEAWHRGMGKYILQILNELNLSTDLNISLIFNNQLKCDRLRFEQIDYLFPNIKQLHCDLPLPEKEVNEKRLQAYRDYLTDYINKQFPEQNKTYLITSLFTFDYFAEFPLDCKRLLLFYDLAPLLLWRDLGGYFPPELYMGRFKSAFEADTIFAISETTRRDLLSVFGLPPEKVININGGFTKIAEKTKKPSSFSVPDRYILFPTGNLPHKNNEVAIKGFEEFCQQNKAVPMLITSYFSEETKQRLSALSKNIIFTGNVSDEELEWLYEKADLVLFASRYEGLGMPILDAVANQRPVITSRIPVFEEMSKQAFYYFDPTSPHSLTRALESGLVKKDFERKLSHYPAIMKKYTWQNTANSIKPYLKAADRQKRAETDNRLSIAVVSLHPGIAGQVGRYAESLHYSLSRKYRVSYYFDPNGYHYRDMERPTFLDHLDCTARDIGSLNLLSYRKYKAVIYLLDDAAWPSRAAQRAAVLTGIGIIDESKNLDEQQAMFKKIALDNQSRLLKFKAYDYEGYQQLVKELDEAIAKQGVSPGPQRAILTGSGSSSRIINRLRAFKSL